MKAIELSGFEGLNCLRVVEVEKPKPGANEVLIDVKAAGINYAELELTKGKYNVFKKPPFIMGFEASGVVVEVGSLVRNLKVGDRIASIVSSGGYAEYATARADSAIPIPDGVSFAEASTITIQGLSAYTLLKFAAKPRPTESVLIQSAAGGVGLYLVQLAKIMGVRKVIALASRKEKIDLVASLGADIAVNYTDKNWADKVRETTDGNGVDVVLEAASGEIGEESLKLAAPFGRIVIFGARNIHDTLSSEKIRQLIYKNQSLIGFNFPSLRPEQVSRSISELLTLISQGKIRLFANNSFPLVEVKAAFHALAGRETIGKLVLTP
jgi:NADPH:quinone reductase